MSLLSGGRLVVCGGWDFGSASVSDSCISWVEGSSSWTDFQTLGYIFGIFSRNHHHLRTQGTKTLPCCLVATFPT